MLTSKLAILLLSRFLPQTQSEVPGEVGKEADWPQPTASSHSGGPRAACCRRQGNDLTLSPTIGTESPERKGQGLNASTAGTNTC